MEKQNTTRTSQAIVLKHVSRSFGSLHAVDNVSLVIEEGLVHSVIGPNGAGKTTLFNLISGNLKCSAGQIFFFGTDITKMSLHLRLRLGLGRTFQITSLFKKLTVAENLMLAMAPKKLGFKSFKLAKNDLTALSLLDKFGLAEQWMTEVENLSHGEQRRMEVILGWALNSKVLLLDEPFAGLSSGETFQMMDLIHKIKNTVTIVLVEHDFDAVFKLSDKITVMQSGRILSEGTPEEIKIDSKVQEAYLGSILDA